MNAFLYYKISITGDKQEYLPVTRHGEGLSWLSGGSRLYESCLRWYLSSTSGDVTASTLHRVGRDTIDKLLSRIDQVSAIMLVMCENGFSVPISSHSVPFRPIPIQFIPFFLPLHLKLDSHFHSVPQIYSRFISFPL